MVTAEEGFLIPKISEDCSKFIDDNFPQDIQNKNISWLSNEIYIFHSGLSGGQKNPEITVIMDKKNKDWLYFRSFNLKRIFRISQNYTNPKRVMSALKKLQ